MILANLVLKGVAATATVTLVDYNGSPVAAGGTVTVDITKADGTALVTGGSTSAGTGTGVYTYALTSTHTANLNQLTLVWKDGGTERTRTYIDIVGAHYFSIAEARASDSTLGSDSYTDQQILDARQEVMDEFERICGVSFIPRFARETLDGSGTERLVVSEKFPTTIKTVRYYTDVANASYSSYTATEIAGVALETSGRMVKVNGTAWTLGDKNYIVEYEYGYPSVPTEIKKVALLRLRYRLGLTDSMYPDRASSVSMADGFNYRLDQPANRSVGSPDIDAVLQRYSFSPIAVA